MTYYFDANILMTANRHDFPIQSAPDFWDWMLEQGKLGIIKFPEAVFEEVGRGNDLLCKWVLENKDIFVEPNVAAFKCLPHVLDAYERPMKEGTLDVIKVDAFVIAHAMACGNGATVVTYEVPNKAVIGKKKKIPTICHNLKIQCVRFPQFIWLMSNLGNREILI